MIRSLDPQSEQFLTFLDLAKARADRAQLEVSSGRRIHTVSDDPAQVGTLMQTRSDLSQVEQVQSNLARVKGEVDIAESVLQNAVSLLEQAQVLGAQGATTALSASNRSVLAGQVNALLDQLVQASRTNVAGRFVFSGDTDNAAPYTFDATQQSYPVSLYQGSAATRQVMHPSGTLFMVARTAQQIFDDTDPNTNAFQAVNNLRLALESNDVNAIQTALGTVRTATDHVNNQLSWYGTVQRQVNEAVDFGNRQELRLKTQLSSIEDADLAESILELQQAQFQQEAAMNVQARVPRTSLFDYLG